MMKLYPMFVLKGANEYQDNVSVLKRLTKIATHPTIHRRDKHEKRNVSITAEAHKVPK